MKNLTITQISEFTYSLKLEGDYVSVLCHSIKRLMKTIHYDEEKSSIFFSAENVLPFKEVLLVNKTYKKCIKMIDDLTKQMNYLKNIGYAFYGFDVNDILTIDNTFIFCRTQHLLPIIEDNMIFYQPIKTPYFSNPEIMELTSLPSEINYKCSFYSLGVLVVLYLLNNFLLVGNEIKRVDEIENILRPIYNTKIYWFIKRCLEENIDKRVLLLI
jgi:serine/threonine protein kinase